MSRYDDEDREAMDAAAADPRYRDVVRQDDDDRVPAPDPDKRPASEPLPKGMNDER